MIETLFLLVIVLSGACAVFFWLHPGFDDCVWGRASLLGMIASALIIAASRLSNYNYSNILPEVVLMLGSQASYLIWLVWRFLRKRRRIASGVDRDLHPS